jgi:hypothetical protein
MFPVSEERMAPPEPAEFRLNVESWIIRVPNW